MARRRRHAPSCALGERSRQMGHQFNPLSQRTQGRRSTSPPAATCYGDTLFNDRPGIATDPTKPGVVPTPYGLLDPNPTPGQPLLPRNFGRGPGQIMLNMRVGRTFRSDSSRTSRAGASNTGGVSGGLGGGTGRGDTGQPIPIGWRDNWRHHQRPALRLVVSMQIRNLMNHNNPGPIIGNIAPRFSARPTSQPAPETRFSPRTPITGDWSCR